jgi:hypothetical protein
MGWFYGLQIWPPLQIGLGFPSARSLIGRAVKVVSRSRSRVIFVSVFTGRPLFIKVENLGWHSIVQHEIARLSATVPEMYHPSPAALKRELAHGLVLRYADLAVAQRDRIPVRSQFHWNRR